MCGSAEGEPGSGLGLEVPPEYRGSLAAGMGLPDVDDELSSFGLNAWCGETNPLISVCFAARLLLPAIPVCWLLVLALG